MKTYKAPNHLVDIPWNKVSIRREDEYNLQYDSKPNYIVIDTIIEDGLELCDLLHYDNTNLYLIHVKYGFSSKMRELTNQISLSARRLKDLIGTQDRTFFEKVYSKLVSKGRSVNELSLDEFINLFFDRSITYVLAFSSHLTDDLVVENNIDRYDSNIARFSLVQCSGEMRSQYYMMLVKQIGRE